MPALSFEDLREKLDSACEFLRSFTLGRQGYTQQDGISGIQRVSDLCDTLKDRFAIGPEAEGASRVIASGRARIKAANARLDLLRARV